MAGFLFRLETVDGEPADPPTFEAAVPNWRLGDEIPLRSRWAADRSGSSAVETMTPTSRLS